jgi:hypothetical protein
VYYDVRFNHLFREIWKMSRKEGARLTKATIPALVCLLFGLAGCGGGSGSSTGPVGPIVPQQVFATIDAPGAGTSQTEGTFPVDINASGDVVGFFYTDSNVSHSFLRTHDGTLKVFDPSTFDASPLLGSSASAINASGQIAGSFWAPLAPPTPGQFPTELLRGYLRTGPEEFQLIEFIRAVLGQPQTYTTVNALSINDAGVVAGSIISNAGLFGGFVRPQGSDPSFFTPPGATSVTSSYAFNCRINATGTVAGFFWQTGATYRSFVVAPDGTVTEVGAPGASTTVNTGTLANDISASGVIVGQILVIGGSHSFVRAADGTFTVFDPPLAGNGGSTAQSINDRGAIAGAYADQNNLTHGYIRAVDGTFVTVDEPNASEAANTVGTFISRINVNGAIVGQYFDAAGVRHGFVRE